jgi:hypothetical protein
MNASISACATEQVCGTTRFAAAEIVKHGRAKWTAAAMLNVSPRQFDGQPHALFVGVVAPAGVGDLFDPWRQGEVDLQR